jgi:CubicO group peptidase (beta-lactamase class C family)
MLAKNTWKKVLSNILPKPNRQEVIAHWAGIDYQQEALVAIYLLWYHQPRMDTQAIQARLWVDPTKEIVFVFLSNRVNTSAENTKINTLGIRRKVMDVVYKALK